jgi:opacity protein-like surface antigen
MASVGWAFGNGLRVEIEVSDRADGIDNVSTLRANGLTVPLTNAGGDANTSAVMANVAYDIPVGSLGLPVQPYVGAGMGYAWLDLGNVHGNGLGRFSVSGNNTVTAPDLVSFGSGGAFAYQAFAGVSLPIAVLPGLEATLEYRFFGTARADIPVNRVGTAAGDFVNGVTPSSSTRNGFVLHDSSVLVGLRYSFGFL